VVNDGDPEQRLRVQLLGPVRCWAGGIERDLGTPRQKAVLAVLALSPGEVVPVARIVRAVWADDPPVNGVNVVQKYVAGLRQVLEPERPARAPGLVIIFSDAGYRLVIDPGDVDAVVLDRRVTSAAEALRVGQPGRALGEAAAAFDLWRGEPLAGLPGPWFAASRDRLDDVRARAVEVWAASQLDLGRPEAAIGELTGLLAARPLRERCCELLMLALHRSGRTAEALAVYRRSREQLVEQTGLEPSAALSALHHRLLAGDPPAVEPAAVEPGARRPPASRPQPVASVPVVPADHARRDVVPARTGLSTVLRLLLSFVPVLTLGIATWPVIALFAVVRRSVRLALATAGYLGLTAVGFLLLGPDHPSELMADIGTLVMLVLTFGGGVHVAALAFRLGQRPVDSAPREREGAA